METIKNLLKNNTFFTQPREGCNYGEGGTVRWSSIYKSNTIYNHKKIGITDMDELLAQIKPFLYYLASKDVNREGDGYIFETNLLVGLFWKYKKSNDEYDYKYIRIGEFHINNIGSGLNFVSFIPVDDVDCRELEKPFEIHIDVRQEHNLLIVGAEEEEEEEEKPPKPLEESFRIDKCVICLDKEPNILFTDCNHICICSECEKIKSSVKCSYCRTEISKKKKKNILLFT